MLCYIVKTNQRRHRVNNRETCIGLHMQRGSNYVTSVNILSHDIEEFSFYPWGGESCLKQ